MARSRNGTRRKTRTASARSDGGPVQIMGAKKSVLSILSGHFAQRWQGDLAGIAEKLTHSWMLPPMQQAGIARQPPRKEAIARGQRIDTDKVRAHLSEGGSGGAA